MIKNAEGQVAIAFKNPIPKVVNVGGKGFAFVVKHQISISWIDEPYVDQVLAIKVTCCGGRTTPAFIYATENQVKVWLTGSY